MKQIKNALISVFHKEGLAPIVEKLHHMGTEIYSTGGTYDFIESLGVKAKKVEDLTGYPSILGGRVKTLHPKVFGGILHRGNIPQDQETLQAYHIPCFDMVIVDLYPFEATVAKGGSEAEIIEKIDIGGISLIRAASKNFREVWVVPSMKYYSEVLALLEKGGSELQDRKRFATYGFAVSSHYDSAIFHYFNQQEALPYFRESYDQSTPLRYGENPHQKALFAGDLSKSFTQLHGKEISYNNLLDIDAAVRLIRDFDSPSFAIIKHNNACGAATRPTLKQSYIDALAGDPVSAFGGIFVSNRPIDEETATEMNKIFMEVCIAPDYSKEALDLLFSKKNRIILKTFADTFPKRQYKSVLNGVLWQDTDTVTEDLSQMKSVTDTTITEQQAKDLVFANKLVKHTKSNAIVLAKNEQLLGSGTGQTSRVDALKQAIAKAQSFGFDLSGAVMASDAFFPFPDCVEIAHQAGITAVIHPGGSIRDQESIDFCKNNHMAMVITGTRHFKH